jgi:hypothetical protein
MNHTRPDSSARTRVIHATSSLYIPVEERERVSSESRRFSIRVSRRGRPNRVSNRVSRLTSHCFGVQSRWRRSRRSRLRKMWCLVRLVWSQTQPFHTSGHLHHTCVVKREMSISLRELWEEHCSGTQDGWDNLLRAVPGGSRHAGCSKGYL